VPSELGTAVSVFVEKFIQALGQNADVRSAARDLLRAAAAALDGAAPPAAKVEEPPRPAETAAAPVKETTPANEPPAAAKPAPPLGPLTPLMRRGAEAPRLPSIPVEEALRTLKLGSKASEPEPVSFTASTGWSRSAVEPEDLPDIEARCRLKAEAARWAAERLRRMDARVDYHAEIGPIDRDIIARAKALPDCFLWTNHSSFRAPNDLLLCDQLGGGYETLGEAAGLLQEAIAHGAKGQHYEKALQLAAEAQSALRAAILAMEGPNDDDQLRVYNFLRATASREQIFIERYMRADDAADPTTWEERKGRILAARGAVETVRSAIKNQQKRLGRLKYHLEQLKKGSRTPDYDWQKVAETIDELLADGMQPSSVEIRELLLPMADDIPEMDPMPQGLQRVLLEMDQYLALRNQQSQERFNPRDVTDEVRRVGELLKGWAVVLIGGVPRPKSKKLIEDAFGLRELVWLETREHQSIEPFEAEIARPDVMLVILAIRWSSHSFGDVKAFCDRHGKPLVRLPAGYSPNQIAKHILDQCSERLLTTAK
jgi:hypothetical protein